MESLLMIGGGFVGSTLLSEYCRLAFAGELPRKVIIVDDDTLERRNCANQNFSLSDAMEGLPKAEALAKMVKSFSLPVAWHQMRVTEANIAELLDQAEAKVIIDAVDNLKTRQLVYLHGYARGIPVLHLGITEMGTGVVEWSHPDHDTFHLAPHRTVGKDIKDPESGVTPPCELVRLRPTGLNLGWAAALALAMYQGFDPLAMIPEGSHGWLTDWNANPQGYQPIRETWSYVG